MLCRSHDGLRRGVAVRWHTTGGTIIFFCRCACILKPSPQPSCETGIICFDDCTRSITTFRSFDRQRCGTSACLRACWTAGRNLNVSLHVQKRCTRLQMMTHFQSMQFDGHYMRRHFRSDEIRWLVSAGIGFKACLPAVNWAQ